MEKKKPYGNTVKDRLRAGARDRLHLFMLADGAVRGAILHGTRMVNEMRSNHGLGILETLTLGRAYLGVGLMAADLKGADRLSLQINCSGPIKGLSVEGNAYGEVRGYLKRVPIPIDRPLQDFDLSPFFGAGLLSVTRNIEGARQPFTGQVELRYGNIAQDLAHYYMTSEQKPSALNLSIRFDPEGEVTGAGGLRLQAMPQADDRLAAELEALVLGFPSLGEVFTGGQRPEEVVREVFAPYAPKFLTERRVEFMCHCNRERLRRMLMLLPESDLRDLRDNGPYPLNMLCHNCGTDYEFTQAEMQGIYGERYGGA